MVVTRRALSVALLAALMSWLLPTTSSAGTRAFCGSAKPTRLHAFHVETSWNKKVYKRGETAVVEVTVTRPAHEDPLELGIPIPSPVSVPAEAGIPITTAVITNTFPPPFGRGVTEEGGKVKLKVPLKGLKAGSVDTSTYASKWTNENGCPDIEEWGWKGESPAFVVR